MADQLARIADLARQILAVAGEQPQDPGPGALTPPQGFTATFDTSTRRITGRFVAQTDAVQVHEDLTDPTNTLKATLPPGASVYVSSELKGGHPYRYGLCSVRDGEVSDFTEWITIDVPLKGEEFDGQDDDEGPGEERPPGEPSLGGPYPLDILRSKAWKLTTALEDPERDGKVWEIYRPELDTYASANWRVNAAGTAIEITCPFDGFTTENSSNVRWELRQMLADGSNEVEWSTDDGRNHRLVVDTQIDEFGGNHIVFAQFHGGDDDLTVGRAEPNDDGATFTIWITHGDETHGFKAVEAMPIGQRYRWEMESDGAGRIHYWLDGVKVPHIYQASDDSVYGKAGLYLQRKGEPGSQGRVTLYDAYMTGA